VRRLKRDMGNVMVNTGKNTMVRAYVLKALQRPRGIQSDGLSTYDAVCNCEKVTIGKKSLRDNRGTLWQVWQSIGIIEERVWQGSGKGLAGLANGKSN
jgi:hypothetical protein